MWVNAFMNTAGLMIGSSLVAILTGTTSAFLLHRYKWPLHAVWKFAAVIPLAIPAHLYALAALSYLDPQGFLQNILRSLGFDTYWDPKGMLLLCLTVGISLSPYCYLFMVAALRRQDSDLEDSAKILRPKATLLTGLWPFRISLLIPAAAASIWFVAIDSFGDLGASVVFGQDTLMTLIYDTWTGLYSFEAALSLSMVSLVVFGFLFYFSPARKIPQTSQRVWNKSIPNGKTRIYGLLFFVTFFVISSGLPLALFIFQSIQLLVAETSKVNIGEIGLQILSSTGVALLTATLCAAFGLFLVFTQHRLKTPRWLIEIGYIGYALPGLIFGLAFYFVSVWFLRIFGMAASPLFSFFILVMALSAKFYAVSSKSVHSILRYQDNSLMESAMLLNKNIWQYFRKIFWAGTRPAWFAGALLIALEALKEVPMTIVLRPFGFQSLSTSVFELAAEGHYGRASLPALMLACLGLVFLYLLDPEKRDS
jgi:iron(III) transport system permease protein